MQLTLDIPSIPLCKTEQEQNSAIPTIPIYHLLKKFDGITPEDSPKGRKTFRISRLPKYIIFVLRRF
jgi:U4/U6.U5 tri-snRNP-associated protein 2